MSLREAGTVNPTPGRAEAENRHGASSKRDWLAAEWMRASPQ